MGLGHTLFLLLVISTSAFAGPGFVRTAIQGKEDNPYAVAIQEDGKIVVAGSSRGEKDLDLAVARYEPNGNLDLSFNGKGFVVTDFGNDEEVYSMLLQQDGKILVSGAGRMGSDRRKDADGKPDWDYLVVRYQADGTLDPTFAQGGKFVYGFGFGNDKAFGMAFAANESIILAGTVYVGSDSDEGVMKLLPNGTLDQTFGKNGVINTSFGIDDDYANAVVVQPDAKIVVAGNSKLGKKNLTTLARYSPTGVLDPTFGKQGKVVTNVRGTHDTAFAMGLQADGRLLVAGTTSNGSDLDYALVRYQADGNLDLSFATFGKRITRVGNNIDNVYSLVSQADGKIVLGGSYFDVKTFQFESAILRFSAKGMVDEAFGRRGKVLVSLDKRYDAVYGMAMQKDGKIVSVGPVGGETLSFAVARFLPNGQPDTTFGGGEAPRQIASPPKAEKSALLLQPPIPLKKSKAKTAGAGFDSFLAPLLGYSPDELPSEAEVLDDRALESVMK